MSWQTSKIKLAKELSDMVIYCKSVHFNSFEHARDNQAFYEMSSFKENKALNLAETSGTQQTLDQCSDLLQQALCNRIFQPAASTHVGLQPFLMEK